MWLSKNAAKSALKENSVGFGEVTIAGAAPSVITEGEMRSLHIVSPAGYVWRPKAGETVLVLKDAEGDTVVSGMPQGEIPEDLAGGEVLIRSRGGSFIRLYNDGRIEVSGDVNIKGSLSVNGVPHMPE